MVRGHRVVSDAGAFRESANLSGVHVDQTEIPPPEIEVDLVGARNRLGSRGIELEDLGRYAGIRRARCSLALDSGGVALPSEVFRKERNEDRALVAGPPDSSKTFPNVRGADLAQLSGGTIPYPEAGRPDPGTAAAVRQERETAAIRRPARCPAVPDSPCDVATLPGLEITHPDVGGHAVPGDSGAKKLLVVHSLAPAAVVRDDVREQPLVR